ncbi:hypothetical protein GQ42DRAFT_164348 [Ramicandelaber brevisporus]|nr:hypothetical protein GQ42DRAFT_164348 [Ramicandelaber brevisporus]
MLHRPILFCIIACLLVVSVSTVVHACPRAVQSPTAVQLYKRASPIQWLKDKLRGKKQDSATASSQPAPAQAPVSPRPPLPIGQGVQKPVIAAPAVPNQGQPAAPESDIVWQRPPGGAPGFVPGPAGGAQPMPRPAGVQPPRPAPKPATASPEAEALFNTLGVPEGYKKQLLQTHTNAQAYYKMKSEQRQNNWKKQEQEKAQGKAQVNAQAKPEDQPQQRGLTKTRTLSSPWKRRFKN